MIPYIGGKSAMAGWIISNFPGDYEKLTYCEVFGGGGWVLFKKEPSYLEIYNDLNSDLVNLFKVIRDNYSEFQYKAEWSLHSREMYQEARERLKDDKFLSDIEKAMHYSINRCQSFAGNGGWGYSVKAEKIVSGMWLPFLRRIQYINARLKRTQIECLDFEKLIRKYDTPNTLFYLDPPYVDAEFYYNTAEVHFTREDHARLAKLLRNVKGKFALSYYENSYVRKLYKGFRFIKKNGTKASYGCTRNLEKKVKPKSVELLIRNY